MKNVFLDLILIVWAIFVCVENDAKSAESAIPEVHSIALRLLDVPAPASAPPSGTLCVCTANGLICDCPDGVCPEGCLLVSADLLSVVPSASEPKFYVAKISATQVAPVKVITLSDKSISWVAVDGKTYSTSAEVVARNNPADVISAVNVMLTGDHAKSTLRSALSGIQYTCANGVCTPIHQTATTIPDDFHTPWYHPVTRLTYQNQNVTGSSVQYVPRAVFGGGNRLLGGGCAGGKCGR